jgi:hypothetical protein
MKKIEGATGVLAQRPWMNTKNKRQSRQTEKRPTPSLTWARKTWNQQATAAEPIMRRMNLKNPNWNPRTPQIQNEDQNENQPPPWRSTHKQEKKRSLAMQKLDWGQQKEKPSERRQDLEENQQLEPRNRQADQ